MREHDADIGHVDVGGVKTRYLVAGDGAPVVLVHGGHFGRMACAEDWGLNIDGLGRHFRVYAPDKIGQGYTGNPGRDEDWVIGTTVDHLRGFAEALDLGPAHFVGHSRGGYTVTRLALDHPQLVKSVTIVSSATLMIPPNPVYREWDRCARAIENRRDRLRYLVTANSWSGAHVTDAFLDALEAIDDLPKAREADARMNAGLFKAFSADLVARQAETHARIRQGELRAPLLIMWGYDDPSARFDPIGVDLLRLVLPSVPGAQVHLLNQAGHYVYRERPAQFNDALTSFVNASR